MENADRCVCVRDRQRCSRPFSYITVEMGFFKAFPTFLSDGWMRPGSRKQCCMCCFSCSHAISISVFCHITHARACSSFFSQHAVFHTLSSPIFVSFIHQPYRLFHYQPETVCYTGGEFRQCHNMCCSCY